MEKTTLKSTYYTPSKVGSLGGVKKLKNATKLPLSSTRKWLIGERAYTLHKPARKRMSAYRSYKVPMSNYQLQMDLNDMIKWSPHNSGYKYIMTVIDVFSRYAWAFPLKTKEGKNVLDAIKRIGVKPLYIQVDQGTEFYNSSVQNWLRNNGIRLFSVYSPQKAAMVERFNRTLKTRMFRYFTQYNTHRWIDILPDLLKSYNNTPHSSLPKGLTPVDAREKINWWIVWNNMNRLSSTNKSKLKIGDHVRISKVKRVFEKGYLSNWSEQIFTITSIDKTQKPIMYTVKDYNNEEVLGKFYTLELQLIRAPKKYPIEKIIKRKNGKFLVKFLGYPEHYWTNSIESTL